MAKDLTAILPSGEEFEFWEKTPIYDRELHVCCNCGDDATADGSIDRPFKTVNAAAKIATPGTRVVIHAGVYRECITPEMGGESPERMIAYEAAGDGEVVISASEIVTDFCRSEEYAIGFGSDPDNEPFIWQHVLDPDMFRGYNPFGVINCIHEKMWLSSTDDPIDLTNYLLRRGMVFVDGKPLKQVAGFRNLATETDAYWVEEDGMKINFRLANDEKPQDHLIEIGCRKQCFAPFKPFLNYIKVKGLVLAHAGNGGPVPQVGALSVRRGHHWIVEDCEVRWANTVGMDFGNHGWSVRLTDEHMTGHSICRRNKIYDCGVCGITGFAATDMLIEDNLVARTGWQRMELAWESGAMKLHNSANTLVRRNIFVHNIGCEALWMDCENYNDRYTQNLFLDTFAPHAAVYMECNRLGENLLDNNIVWDSRTYFPVANQKFGSQGWDKPFEDDKPNGEGIHGDGTDDLHIVNNFIGNCDGAGFSMNNVNFRMYGGRGGTSRNARIYNNIIYNCRSASMRLPHRHVKSDGNAFANPGQGFLRIVYPAPSICLDLPSWQEFEGLDLNSTTVSFDVDIDCDAFTMTIKPCDPKGGRGYNPFGSRTQIKGFSQLPKVAADPAVLTDFFGNIVDGERIPGPFTFSQDEITFSIDPRKL